MFGGRSFFFVLLNLFADVSNVKTFLLEGCCSYLLGRRYTKRGLQPEKKPSAPQKKRKNIAMTDCLVILYTA